MKKILSIISIALLLASCGGGAKKAETTTVSIDSLSGEWVVDGYREALSKTLSPMKTGHILNGYTGICIKDSTFALVYINNHEGITGHIKIDAAGYPSNFIFIPDYESPDTIGLRLDNKNGTKSLTMLFRNIDKGNAIDSTKFEYVAPYKEIKDPCGLTALKLCLEGNWSINDATGKKICDVEIDSFGNIKGWNDYSSVIILTDAMFGGEDEIILRSANRKEVDKYVINFSKGEATIYESIDNDDIPTSSKGKLIYSLVSTQKWAMMPKIVGKISVIY